MNIPTISKKVAIPAASVLAVALIGSAGYYAYSRRGTKQETTSQTPRQVALAAYSAKDYAKAETTLKQQAAADPSDASTYNILGNVSRDQNKTDEAAAYYKQAISKDANLAPAYINLASLYVNAGKRDEAKAIIDQGLVKFPQNKVLLELKGEVEK